MSAVKLKVLTLNSWGIGVPIICLKKDERISAIGEELSQSDFDIVFLQEVWVYSDYEKIKKTVSKVMPHAHFYRSGIIGSGLCVFSRHEIMATSQYCYIINGYAHRLLCGDWYGEKSIGLARLIMHPSGVRVNAYTTHLHANYNEHHHYNSQRCLQAYQLATVVKETSCDCDVVVLAGDFNITPDEIGYEMITSLTGVQDSWRCQKDISRATKEESTCCRRDNTFWENSTDTPVRLDYIFMRSNTGYQMSCELCELGMRRLNDGSMSYSDHEGVVAVYDIKQSASAKVDETNNDKLLKTLKEGVVVLEKGVVEARHYRFMWFLAFVGCVTLVIMAIIFQFCGLQNAKEVSSDSFLSNLILVGLKYFFFEGFKLMLVLLGVFSILHAGIVMTREINITNSIINDMRNRLNFLKDEKKHL